MISTKIFFVAIVLKCVLIRDIVCGTDMSDLKQKYADMIMSCASGYPITAEDIEVLKKKMMPDNEHTKCLFACAYKKTGMMDDKGMLSVEGVNKLARMYLADNPERLKQAEQFTDACKDVNDQLVKDGDKGCDRAALIFKCSIEKASQFDLSL